MKRSELREILAFYIHTDIFEELHDARISADRILDILDILERQGMSPPETLIKDNSIPGVYRTMYKRQWEPEDET